MARRDEDVKTLTVPATKDEAAVIDEMKIAAAVVTDADLVRVALWNLADHLDIEMPNGVFDLRPRMLSAKARAARKAQQHANKTAPAETPIAQPQAQPQPADHPWRQLRID